MRCCDQRRTPASNSKVSRSQSFNSSSPIHCGSVVSSTFGSGCIGIFCFACIVILGRVNTVAVGKGIPGKASNPSSLNNLGAWTFDGAAFCCDRFVRSGWVNAGSNVNTRCTGGLAIAGSRGDAFDDVQCDEMLNLGKRCSVADCGQ